MITCIGKEIRFFINFGPAITKNGVPQSIDVNSVFKNRLTTTSYVILHKITRNHVIFLQLNKNIEKMHAEAMVEII